MVTSIRSRLALGHVAIWALILAASAAAAYHYAAYQLRGQMDEELASCVQVISQSVQHEVQEHTVRSEGEMEFAYLLRTVHHQSFAHQAIAVFEGDRLVAGKSGDAGAAVKSPPPAFRQEPVIESRVIEGKALRVAARHVTVSGLPYVAVAAVPEANVTAALVSLRRVLSLFVVLALTLSIAGGYFLARQALRPVVAMADSVDRISVRDLSQQIEIANPDDELGHLGATFNRLLNRIHHAFQLERQFVADASHELRTPLSVSLLSAQIALENPRSAEEYRSTLVTIRSQLERLTGLVRDMLTLARSDAGALALNKRRCGFDDLILEAASAAGVLAREKRIRMIVSELPEASVEGDPDLLERVVLILLDNAVKYSREGSAIRVTLRADGSKASLDVRDEGPGIPPQACDRIFDRFYRVDLSRAGGPASGVGLGLSIAKQIAHAHGGSIELVESTPQGSWFRVCLPLAENDRGVYPATPEPTVSAGADFFR
jgi:heavy metal sensor kinase